MFKTRWQITILTLIILIVIVSVIVRNQQFVTKDQKQTKSSPIIPKPASVSLELKPNISQLTGESEATYSIVVDMGNFRTYGMQGYFNFDPSVIEVIAIEVGAFLKNPVTLMRDIDNDNGTVAFTLGSQIAASGHGEIMMITIKILSPPPGSFIPLTFDTRRTRVSAESVSHDQRYTEDEIELHFSEKPLTIVT